MKIEHLMGRQFDWEKSNCYDLLRDVFKSNWGIELTPYAVPADFHERDLDLFNQLAHEEGFQLLDCHPRDHRPGDVVIHAIQSSRGNHCSIITPEGRLFTVMVGGLSSVYPFGGLLRNTMVAVYRHRDVPAPEEELVDLADLLPRRIIQ